MLNKSKIIMVLAGVMTAFSYQVHATGQSINGQTISALSSGWGGEGYYIYTTSNVTSNDGCGPAYFISPNNPMFKVMVSELLTAFSTGAKINIYVDGCASSSTMNAKAIDIIR